MEWKRVYLNGAPEAPRTLETFLGGMETTLSFVCLCYNSFLETFLGGMETSVVWDWRALKPSLKPSLVEWKPLSRIRFPLASMVLETFLGGMETKRNS